jgi:GT2 family glycosyltransferase
LDNDVYVHKEMINDLVAFMEKSPSVGAAQPRLLDLNNPSKIDSDGGMLNYIGYSRILYNTECATSPVIEITYAGATFLVRKALLFSIDPLKPFDEDYIVFHEDVDFCWKIWLLGLRVISYCRAIAYHERHLSKRISSLSNYEVFLNDRNSLITLVKNYSLSTLSKYLTFIIFFRILKIIILVPKEPMHSMAAMKSALWILLNLKKVFSKRYVVQQRRLVRDSFIKLEKIHLGILVMDFLKHYGSRNS